MTIKKQYVPDPSPRSVVMHKGGDIIRVEPHEVKDWEAEGFRRYREQPRGRNLSKKARKAQAKQQGQRVSREPTEQWLKEHGQEPKPLPPKVIYRRTSGTSINSRLKAAIEAHVGRIE